MTGGQENPGTGETLQGVPVRQVEMVPELDIGIVMFHLRPCLRRTTPVRLFDGIDRQYAIADRNAVAMPGGRDALDAFARNVVEMWRTAANHATQRDDAVRTPRGSDLADRDGHLEGAGNPHDLDICIRSAVLAQAMQRALQQRFDDEVVEARRDDDVARVTRDQVEAWVDQEQIVDVSLKDRKLSIWWEQEPVRPFGIATWNTAGALRKIRLKQ